MDILIINALITAKATQRQMNGQSHMVVPVVALQEGVLKDVYYSDAEISNFAVAWNGVPVPVRHPQEAGQYISANSPLIEETTNIGRLYNVNYADKKLTGEIWINIAKAKELGHQDILDKFEKGDMMEVSTAMYSNNSHEQGTFNGLSYNMVAKNIRPDHLALLPDEKGACSIEDGCGAMRINNAEKDCGCGFGKTHNVEKGFTDKLKDLLTNHINILNKIITNKGEDKPMDKEKFIDELIANDANQYTAEDKAGLMTLDEKILEKMKPVANDDKAEGDKEEKAKDEPNANSDTPIQFSKEDIEMFNRIKANEQVKVESMRKLVTDNYKGLTANAISALNFEQLEGLVSEIKLPANYLQGGTPPNANADTRKPPSVLLANLQEENKKAETTEVK